ncbi:2-aminoethylphosphonate ABC transport system ATP-binding subunit PhnT [Mangrovactinospora gilvigrisea]|uniref:ABC-type quaternary amine transporter n=1 Tax=Mangrovactinospora gilvigrisea TaxID=1428644 RepID=A0A1J7BXV7_9ACTN|nr:2-aminoethylphosphonate ABC transport system ATP-binding subunit PhnT [Mangrovactinospora gilvigrisea]
MEAAAAEQPAGIRFEDVTVSYHGTTVLDGLTLDVRPGEVMALLGPSGSGKTTALRSVAGFVEPERGRIHLAGRDITELPPHRRGIGMVVQSYALFPHMRVDQNVAFGLQAQRVPRAEIPARVADALGKVGMADYARRHPRELSGGQQQRVAIARALAIRPRVLLLDEPLSALDAQLRTGMLAELARLHRELPELTILYVTHDQIEALTLADRIGVMRDAKLVDCGTAEELYRAPRDEFVARFLGGANLLPVRIVGDGPRAGTLAAALVGPDGVDASAEPLAVTGGGVAAGERALVCVRPHLLRLAGDAGLPGTVVEVQWRGAVHRLTVDVAGHAVTVDAPELKAPPAPGETVRLSVAAEDAVLLGSGRRG